MARVLRTVHIDAPSREVFALAADPARIADLDPRIGLVQVERDNFGPRRIRFEFGPGGTASAADIIADVTLYVAGRDLTVESPAGAGGPQFRLHLSCREADGGTDLTCEAEVRWPGLGGRLADPLLGAALAQQVGGMLSRVEREVTTGHGA